MKRQKNWIHSAAIDFSFILLPPILASFVTLLLVHYFHLNSELTPLMWLILVVGVDVSHVYSTYYRIFFKSPWNDPNRIRLYWIAGTGWLAGVVLYSLGPLYFWRALAYLAVFHFVRQQYGFMMIYSRHQSDLANRFKTLDKTVIYATMLYPLFDWHTRLPRSFDWFVQGDFIPFQFYYAASLKSFLGLIYSSLLLFYSMKELWIWKKEKHLNLPKSILLFGTALSWYTGIVIFNGDLAFTLTNVISHGIPYIALIWIYGKKSEIQILKFDLFSLKALPLFLGGLLGLALFEEFLWDNWVWHDHREIFGNRGNLELYGISHEMLISMMTWIVPLLTLPQLTHYVLDGFLWKLNRPKDRLF